MPSICRRTNTSRMPSGRRSIADSINAPSSRVMARRSGSGRPSTCRGELDRGRVLGIHGRVSAAPSSSRQRLVHRDSREPRGELRAAVELTQVAVRVDVGLLHDVLGLAFVPEDGPSGAVEPLVVAPHQHLEERRLAGQNTGDHLLVREQGPAFEHPRVHHLHVTSSGKSARLSVVGTWPERADTL